MEESVSKRERGLTWRSLLALLYITFVFQSAMAFMHLVTGFTPAYSAIQWATVLLFIELSAVFAGTRLSLPEAIIIYLASTQTIKYWWFLAPPSTDLSHPGWIYQIYLRYSPVTKAVGLADKVPWFYAPLSPEVWIQRTLFHSEWAPVALLTAAYWITVMIGTLTLTILGYQLYVRIEKLPFPLADPIVDTARTLVEREWRRMAVLGVSSALAFIYGFIIYTFPLIGRVFWNISLQIIPIPWVDYNALIQQVLPGASLGISTDLAVLALGFIIPFKVALGALIGSIALYTVGNYLLVTYEITGFAKEYTYGLSIASAWQRSVLWAWAMPLIGFGVAIGVVPLLLHPGIIYRAVNALRRIRESGVEFSIGWIMALYFLFTVMLSLVDYWLAPDLPIIYYILLNVVLPFILMLVVVRGEGLGLSINVPYVRELTLKASGYTGINAWFVPTHSVFSWVTSFKVCDMTKTRIRDLIIAMFIVFPVALVVGYVTMQAFWSIAPIPSAIYPGVLYTWPVQATVQAIFISPQAAEFFNVPNLIYGFLAGGTLYALGDFLGFASLIVGIAGGMASPVPSAIATFIGAIVGKVISRFIGEEQWREIRGVVYAGILLGEGLIVSIGTGLAVIMRSMWAAPY